MDPIKRGISNPSMEGLLSVIEHLRGLDREVPAQVVSVLLYIAIHEPCHKQAIEEDLEFTTASCSRNIAWLSHKHRLNKPGLGLVSFERDPSNRRRYIVELTDKGRDLIKTLENKLYG